MSLTTLRDSLRLFDRRKPATRGDILDVLGELISSPAGAADWTTLANKPSSLATIAGLTATTDNFMVAASSAWASRTPEQAKTSLGLVKADVGLGSVDNTADTAKPVSTAQLTALNLKEDTANKAAASGYASLDAATRLPVAQLPQLSADVRVSTADFTVPANASVVVPADYEIGSGFVTELASNAILEVT